MEEYNSKSRQFTSDSDIIGEVKNRTEGYLTVRTSPLEDLENEQKVVIKYFTKSMNWKASMEELISMI